MLLQHDGRSAAEASKRGRSGGDLELGLRFIETALQLGAQSVQPQGLGARGRRKEKALDANNEQDENKLENQNYQTSSHVLRSLRCIIAARHVSKHEPHPAAA